jgi:hypothetical protein
LADSLETTNPAVFHSNRKGKNLVLVGERTETAPPTPDLAAREAALEAKEAELQAALATVRAALDIAAVRVRSLLALAASVMVFAWSIYDPQWPRIIGAGIFAAMVLWPVLWMDKG